MKTFKKITSVCMALLVMAALIIGSTSMVFAADKVDDSVKNTLVNTAEGLTDTIIGLADADAAELNEKAAQYRELQNGVASAAARGYVDTVISPADTRKYVIGAFEMLFTKREDRPSKKHGTV